MKHQGCETDIFSGTATEAAKLYGMYLYHSGVLNAFNSGADAEIISVHSDTLEVKFRTWFINNELCKCNIILESCFVRRVS